MARWDMAAQRPSILVPAVVLDGPQPATQRSVTDHIGSNASTTRLASSIGWLEQPYDDTGADPYHVVGPDHATEFTTVKAASGSLDDLEGDTVAITDKDAEDAHLEVGDTVRYRFSDGGTLPGLADELRDVVAPGTTISTRPADSSPTTTPSAARSTSQSQPWRWSSRAW